MLANSGASLVVVEATGVERRGRITHGCTGIYSDSCEDAFARIIAHCKRIGTAKFGIQLAHAGRKASSARPWEGGLGLKPDQDPWQTIGPLAIAPGAAWHEPRAMNEADMAQVREAFVTAAKRALRIGFDSIELHMAHGYLMHSFVSPISNKRNDAYGGSLEGRMKFPLEVLRAVRAVLPKDLPLGARISSTDWMEGGLTGDDSVAWVAAMKQAGLDFVCVLLRRCHGGSAHADHARLQRADRRTDQARDRIATARGRPDRDARSRPRRSSPTARPT
jgi:NADPH2 dehydrogenase